MVAQLLARRGVLRSFFVGIGVASAFAGAPALASAWDNGGGDHGDGHGHGAVYTATNSPTGNAVIVFRRHADGTLSESQTVPTGGNGADNQPPFGFPVVDSSQSLRLSPDGRLLFVVNGGSNTVSSFRVTEDGLEFVSQAPSGGSLPISLDDHGNLLYVLNENGTGNISGLRISDGGQLTPIPNSTQPLSSSGNPATFNGAPAQVGFSPDGRVLNVTERLTNTIDTFKMDDGRPGPAVPSPSTGHQPFGFAYQDRDNLVVTNANAQGGFVGSASSYDLHRSSTPPLTPISGPVLSGGGAATCWVVITDNGRWAFMSNTLSGNSNNDVSTFAVAPDGSLTWVRNAFGTAGFTSDLDLSRGGRYLYVLQPSNVTGPLTPAQAPAPNTSHIDEFSVDGGNLTLIGSTPSTLPNSMSGLAAW